MEVVLQNTMESNVPETREKERKIILSCENFNSDYIFKEIYLSFRVKHSRQENIKKILWNNNYDNGGLLTQDFHDKEAPTSLTRSDYSLVSCTELTPGAIELWLELPDEVKNDPYFENFRKIYEDERGKTNNLSPNQGQQKEKSNLRLPQVKSAPHLNNNISSLSANVSLQNGAKNTNGVTVLPDTEEKIEGYKSLDFRQKDSKMARARHYVKMSILVSCWIFFSIVFMLYNEREEIVKHSSVAAGETKNYLIPTNGDSLRVRINLIGPFLAQQAEQQLNKSEFDSRPKMEVWLEKWVLDGVYNADNVNVEDVLYTAETEHWSIVLLNENLIDFTEGEARSNELILEDNSTIGTNRTRAYAIRMHTTSNTTTPFTISYTKDPLDVSTGVIYASVLLCGLYILIIFEVVNRTMAAILMSMTALAVLSMVGERPSIPEIISWLDVETLLLLFSMMILVSIMAETGMFDFIAVFTFQVTKGKMWPLITMLCVLTAVVSTFLDNVTTILLTTPVTIRLCEVMHLDPIPILLAMVLFSNIGGTATAVGDPPNVILASNRDVVQAGINFGNFTLHMTIGVLLVGVQTYFQLRFIYRDTNKLRQSIPKDVQNLRQQIAIWRRAAASLPHFSQDEHIVRQALEKKVIKLQKQLDEKTKETTKRACPKETFQSTLAELKEKHKINDRPLLIKSSIVITLVVLLFFLHSVPDLQRISLGWTALLGAVLLLILADREDLEPILHRVEWSTLLFFASLFVLMEALSKLGLIAWIGGLTESIILSVDGNNRLIVALMLMLWVSGMTSAFVDNIPLTTMMVRVATGLGTNPSLGLPMAPLIWALSFGACLGGNGTLIGASANVVCVGVAEQHGYKITFMQFFKIGFPVMIGHLVVASVYLLICHCAFTWH